MKHIFTLLIGIIIPTIMKAQIGYQVSLLNKATGEPRANTTVNASVTITDSQNGVIYTGTQKATSNDYGVLSLIVGNENTFKDFDTGKMPLYISVSVDGTLIGKSQILSVPITEVANRIKSPFTIEDILGTWSSYDYIYDSGYKYTFTFKKDGTFTATVSREGASETAIGHYEIYGKNIYAITTIPSGREVAAFYWYKGKLLAISHWYDDPYDNIYTKE